MNRDNFDNELGRKLGDMRIEPPADMWERIAATMRAQGEAATRTDGATDVQHSPRRGMAIRRPRRMRFGWAAAAAILLCVTVFSLRELMPRDEELAQDAPVILTPDQIGDLIATTTDATDAAEPDPVDIRRETESAPVVERPKTSRVRRAVTATADQLPQEQPDTTQTPAADSVATPATASDDNHRTTRTTSDIRRGRAPAYRQEIAEDLWPQRRAAPVDLSVFASNIGALSNERIEHNAGNTSASAAGIYELGAGQTREQMQPYELKHKMPLSGGLSLRKGLTERLSLESGVMYSYLLSIGESRSRKDNRLTYDIEQKLHYVGVPVGVSYDIIQNRNIDLYAGGAALFEMCVSGSLVKTPRHGTEKGKPDRQKLKVKGIQPSVEAHLGAEIRLDDVLGLYVEPGVGYYFENDGQPESYRTAHRLNLSVRAGLRINL